MNRTPLSKYTHLDVGDTVVFERDGAPLAYIKITDLDSSHALVKREGVNIYVFDRVVKSTGQVKYFQAKSPTMSANQSLKKRSIKKRVTSWFAAKTSGVTVRVARGSELASWKHENEQCEKENERQIRLRDEQTRRIARLKEVVNAL